MRWQIGLRLVAWFLALGSAIAIVGCQSQHKGPDSGKRPEVTEPTWVLVGDQWIYVCGDQPTICVDNVCAAAPGTVLIVPMSSSVTPKYYFLIAHESHQNGSAWVKS